MINSIKGQLELAAKVSNQLCSRKQDEEELLSADMAQMKEAVLYHFTYAHKRSRNVQDQLPDISNELSTVLSTLMRSSVPGDSPADSLSPVSISKRAAKPRSRSVRKKAGGAGLIGGGGLIHLLIDKAVMTVAFRNISAGSQTELRELQAQKNACVETQTEHSPERSASGSSNAWAVAQEPETAASICGDNAICW